MYLKDGLTYFGLVGLVCGGLWLNYDFRTKGSEHLGDLVSGGSAENNTFEAIEGDLMLEAARYEAMETLDDFLAVVDRRGNEGASLKVALNDGDTVEHIWVSDIAVIQEEAGQAVSFTGRLANEPVGLPDLEALSKVSFLRDQIDDWGLVENDLGFGFYSVRVMLPRLAPEEAAQMSTFLAPDPIPSDWQMAAAPEVPEIVPMEDPREVFLRQLDNPPAAWEAAMVQVAWVEMVKKPNGATVGYAQRIWVADVTRLEDGSLHGLPVQDARFGQERVDPAPLDFAETQITDWGFVEAGLGYGFETLRSSRPIRSARETEMLAAFLAPERLPEGW